MGASEVDGAIGLDDDRLVRHGRHIRTACSAHPKHTGDLGNLLRGHYSLVPELPPSIREHLRADATVLACIELRTAPVDEVDAGEMVHLGNLLRPDVLVECLREENPSLDCGVIAQEDTFPPVHQPDTGDHAGAMDLPVIAAICGKRSQFHESSARVDDLLDSLPGQELAPRAMKLLVLSAAALASVLDVGFELVG